MKTVAVVNYGVGNLDSVARAVEECGGNPIITSSSRDLASVNYIILPGVGSFAAGMHNIRKRELDKELAEQVIGNRIPFLGICLGMQLLATNGWEVEETPGLGWIEGEVVQFESSDPQIRIPHVGWNEVDFINSSSLFEELPSRKDFYFVHSYHFVCRNKENELAKTPYCGGFTSVVGKENIFGVQFHPEKSQKVGFQILRNFLAQ
jgi:glutamine amidotransferase